jgi:hypothetical protein
MWSQAAPRPCFVPISDNIIVGSHIRQVFLVSCLLVILPTTGRRRNAGPVARSSPMVLPFSSGKCDRERHLSGHCFQLRRKLRRKRDPVLQILRPPAEAALPGPLRLALLGRG